MSEEIEEKTNIETAQKVIKKEKFSLQNLKVKNYY